MTAVSRQPSVGSNTCPVGCGRGVKLGMLMCAPCWHSVPAPLQAEVWRTWRAWKKSAGVVQVVAEYRAASDAAIAAAQERLVQKDLLR